MIKCECGREFSDVGHLKIHKKTCKGPIYCQNPECKNLLEEYQIKFCSKSCASKVNNKGRKVSTKLLNKCLNCNTKTKNPKFCCLKCSSDYRYKTSVNKWLENPELYTTPQYFMKRWFIEMYGEKCQRCGWNEVNQYTKRIPLELHHEDGNWRNNKPENLHLICLNCHSLTKTYRVGNIGHGRPEQRKYYRSRTTKK